MIQTSKEEILENLQHFTGTATWFRHPIVRDLLWTEGIEYLRESAQCYWLIDFIAFEQKRPAIQSEKFQVWKLTRDTDGGAVLTCEDGNRKRVRRHRIPYTDFPLPEIRLFLADNVLMLPSEY